ncbi:MAG: hypothetical protein ACR2FV_14440 [Ornithinimicrobium sp.]|uniref:hypothetical protein n=1 Tax=Ornithinimicrobium sp. TaxID=1977084 RepID=UPI003D9BDF50
MKLAQAMALIVPPIVDLKRRALARADGEHTMYPTLVALREDRVLAVVSTPRMAVTLSTAHTLAVGLAPQLVCVAAQVTLPDGGEGIAYTTMTRDHTAGFALQPYAVHEVSDGVHEAMGAQIEFSTPERGQPEDRALMDELARAMSHDPMDPTRVSRKGDVDTGGTNPALLPQEEGRLAIDAGTCASVQRSVVGVGGRTLYLAASAAHATRLLAHGMPEQVLLH